MSNLDKYIIWERPCNPGLIYIAAEGCVSAHIREFGYPWADTLCFYHGDMVRVLWSKADLVKNGTEIAKNFLQPEYFAEKINRYQNLSKILFAWFEKLGKIKLEELTDEEYLKLLNEYNQDFMAWWGFAQVAEPVATGCEFLLAQKRKLLADQINILTTPIEKSYSTKEEEDILKMVKEITLDNKLSELFEKNEQEVVKELSTGNFALWQNLQANSQAYFWMMNSYAETKYLDEAYFIKQIQEVLKKELTVEQIDKIISGNNQRLKEYEDSILKLSGELNLTEEEKKIVKMIGYFATFQDERKAYSLKANHYTNLFIKELARRSSLNYDLVKYLLPHEYKDLLAGNFAFNHFKLRQKHFAMLMKVSGLELLEGEPATKEEEKLLGIVDSEVISEFEGVRAMGGRIVGRVRKILKSGDIEQMQIGEILVSTMTSPDFIMAMKKASAIVTDEGGLTCHAAVISRELGIPCVIGTKIATRILNTGDLVEVKANHGLIKILERA